MMLRANVELPGEVAIAREQGALGVGLYRTEFLYIDRKVAPDRRRAIRGVPRRR